ncbi:PKD domain-containing protein [Kitasatospora camelliae]|uniref:PKD domain-containing protein n=1 Tax=Kitasatospora camelliae TaxID=3156397 RepID=A0AAU8JUP0_9ACTN
MRLRTALGIAAASAVAVVGLPAPALAITATTLVVDGDSAQCSDTGTGTVARPYCTIAAAAKVVEPGQTVRVLPGSYAGDVHLTRSGTPEKPITFLGGPITYQNEVQPTIRTGTTTQRALVIEGAHDLVVRGFQVRAPKDAITVTDSSRIVLDQLRMDNDAGADIRISGASDHVTVSRSHFLATAGVQVDPGVRATLITANDFNRSRQAAVRIKGAPDTAITHNTIVYSCQESVLIDGAATGALVENNVITADNPAYTGTNPANCGTSGRGEAEISLSADSVTGSKVDYNTVHAWPDAAAYRWAGTAYPTAAAFTSATGQGAHNTDQNTDFDEQRNWPFNLLPATDAADIDAADPTAPGVDTDLLGSKPLDHPKVAGSAPAGGVRDRGAYERTGLHDASLTMNGPYGSTVGPAPLTVTATARATDDWATGPLAYSFDFGDGTAPVASATPEAIHTYTQPGSYRVIATVTTATGARTVTTTGYAGATQPGELTADFTAVPKDGGGTFMFAPTATSPWTIQRTSFHFGDRGEVRTPTYGEVWYRFEYPGTYPVTMTVTDAAGHEATVTKQIQVVYDTEHRVLLPGERVQVLAQSAGSLLSTGANYTSGLWAGITPVALDYGDAPKADRITATASATTSDGWLRAFALADGRIHTDDRNLSAGRINRMGGDIVRGAWVGWSEVGASGAGGLTGVTQIAAASIGNRTHLVALAGGRVYEASSYTDTGRWSAWGDVTAAAGLPAGTTRIAAATTGNSLHIAALGADGGLRIADGNYDRGTWSSGDLTAYRPGPAGITQLSAASLGATFHVLAVAGGDVHQISGDYAAGNWSRWADVSAVTGLNGTVTRVAAAATGNTLRLFALSDGHIHNANGDYTRGLWSRWADVTAPGAAGATTPVTSLTAAGL